MDELIRMESVERVLLAVALIVPILGLAVGWAWGRGRGQRRAGAIQGLCLGLLGPLVWLLWRVYNAIEDYFGLDSVKALLINLGLFLMVGIAVGILWGRSGVQAFRRSDPASEPDVVGQGQPERPNA